MSNRPLPVYPIYGRNSFCGPAVVSALTGISTDQAAVQFRNAMGTLATRQITLPALIAVLAHHGLELARFQVFLDDAGPQLSQWVAEVCAEQPKQIFVVALRSHVCVIRNRYLSDCTHRVPWRLTPARLKPLTAKVFGALRVVRHD